MNQEKLISIFISSNSTLIAQNIRTSYPSLEYRDSLGQVNSVADLQDIAPGHWAYEALRNLVEKYDCIGGYPDGTFRGNNTLNRYEFAASLNKCLQTFERIIGTGEKGPPERSGSTSAIAILIALKDWPENLKRN